MTYIKNIVKSFMVGRYHQAVCPRCGKKIVARLADILQGRDVVCPHCLMTNRTCPKCEKNMSGVNGRRFGDTIRIVAYREYMPC